MHISNINFAFPNISLNKKFNFSLITLDIMSIEKHLTMIKKLMINSSIVKDRWEDVKKVLCKIFESIEYPIKAHIRKSPKLHLFH